LQLVSLTASPLEVEAGDTLTISGALRNDGISAAKGIRVSVSSMEDILEETGMGVVYLGSLSSGSQAPFSSSLKVKEAAAPGKYTLMINISFKDDLGREHSSTYPLQIKGYS